MSTHDFMFSMRLAGRGLVDLVLKDVAATVFQQVGCSATVIDGLVDELHAAVTARAGSGEIEVRFRRQDDTCEVTVSAPDREVWRTSRQVT